MTLIMQYFMISNMIKRVSNHKYFYKNILCKCVVSKKKVYFESANLIR